MVLLETPQAELGWHAADFHLLGTNGRHYSLQDVRGEHGLVVMFISNHCPYVKAIQAKLVQDMKELRTLGISSIAICSNDPETYPEDAMPAMQQIAAEMGYPFPYVQDATQDVARAYGAVCTPDFYGFDHNLTLCYRGRLDSAGRETIPTCERELVNAMRQIGETGQAPSIQHPSMGCSIKWREVA